ncbi:MAG TPA: hypothetical protein VME43_17980 [Bryobacteraceae bacterium]|nr:hypothetical protein [Bryobacteraceae bacterium]
MRRKAQRGLTLVEHIVPFTALMVRTTMAVPLEPSKDDPSSGSWGGPNVFDVYSKTTEKLPDGTNYSDWL